MTRRSALLTLYAAFVVFSYGVTALPGLPYFETEGARNFAVGLDLLLFVLIWRGSRAAWATAVALETLMFLFVIFGTDGGLEPGVYAVLGIRACALCVLFLLAPLVERRAAI